MNVSWAESSRIRKKSVILARLCWRAGCTQPCMRWILLTLALAACAPRPASALTVEQVVVLSQSGVSDTVILALIERDNTLFTINSEQLVRLQREGVSEAVLLAMLKSGRAESSEVPAPAASLPPPPDVVIVGHGPERPTTLDDDIRLFPQLIPVPFPLPYVVSHRGHGTPRRVDLPLPQVEVTPQPYCVSTTHAGVPPLLSPITECAPVMPPAPRPR